MTALPTSPIRAVCFDLDGLMFNTEDVFHLSGTELLRRRDLVMTPEIMHAMLGRRPLEAFAALKALLELQEEVEDLLAESRVIFRDRLDEHLQPMPGLFELLDTLDARGLPIAVATSSPRDYLVDILGRFDLLSRFGFTLTAEDVTHGKPHPEIYQTAAERFEVPPGEMLVLEDSQAGTEAAAAAGAFVISIPHVHTAAQDFSAASALATALHDDTVRNVLNAHT